MKVSALKPAILALLLTYPVEHNITKPEPEQPTHTHRRPDLSTFFSTLELIDTSNTNNSHAVPTPGDLAAAFRSLADAYHMMRQEGGSELLETLMERLYETAERPPREVKGVSDEFLAGEWNTLWVYKQLARRMERYTSRLRDMEDFAVLER